MYPTAKMQDGLLKSVLTRRGIFKLGAGFVAVAAVASALGVRALLKDRPPGNARVVFDDDEAAVLVALADAWFPGDNSIGVAAAVVDVVGGVDAYAARLLPRERKLMRVLLRAVDQWPRLSLSSTTSFADLSLADRQAVLRAFETSTLVERRLLGSLLRSIVGMPLFEDPRFLAAIAHRHGCGLVVLEGT